MEINDRSVLVCNHGRDRRIQQAEIPSADTGKARQGYARRYGAAYGDFVSGTFIGSALLPSLLKQDPRYFYKGTGSRKSRFLYAIANSRHLQRR